MYSNNTINTTVDRTTHSTWRNIAKSNGLTMKKMFSLLVAREARDLGKKVPKELKEILRERGEYY